MTTLGHSYHPLPGMCPKHLLIIDIVGINRATTDMVGWDQQIIKVMLDGHHRKEIIKEMNLSASGHSTFLEIGLDPVCHEPVPNVIRLSCGRHHHKRLTKSVRLCYQEGGLLLTYP